MASDISQVNETYQGIHTNSMDKETTPTPNARPGAKYRGAVVEVSFLKLSHITEAQTAGSTATTCILFGGT